MSTVNQPSGFAAVWHPSGFAKARAYPGTIPSGYATNIFWQQPVRLTTTGGIQPITATTSVLGVFAGVFYFDAIGRGIWSPSWPASQTYQAGSLQAFVYDDPKVQYSVQADGAIAQTALGSQSNISNATAGTVASLIRGSQSTLSATVATAGAQKQFRIVQLDPSINNAWGDTYTRVIVEIAMHQYVNPQTAI